MRYEVIVEPDAVEQYKQLPTARLRAEVRDGMEERLRHEPEKVSRSRIKRLRGLRQPQYRLRIGDVRLFYDVIAPRVHVLAIVPKSGAAEWLENWGIPE